MQAKIGKTAGLVWQILKEKDAVEISSLPRMSKEKSVIVYQALGWLARENKLKYRKKGDKVYVSLAAHEKNL